MAPTRSKKRVSDHTTDKMDLVTTPTQKSPIKQRKAGISAHQKQALIDNLQLEITERARRLRAQYNLQAQGMRSRIEIRVNRIPMSLRKVKMEELLLKYLEKEQRAANPVRPPPVPAKDTVRGSQKPLQAASQAQKGRGQKRLSNDMHYDKENEVEHMENPKKKARGAQAHDGHVRPGQVLSPTSSNSRLNGGRPASPTKSQIARPGSPLKGTSRTAAASNMLSNFVEKAKSTRAGGTRKVTTTSNTSATSAGAAPPPKTRRGAPASKAPTSRPATRTGRRVSVNSETSEGSNGTVVRKAPAPKTTTKKVMGAFSKGTASGDAKKAAAKPTPSTTRTGRVLRNRG